MEQKREMTFEEAFSTIKQDGFLKTISVDRHYRLGWFFFYFELLLSDKV